MRLAAAIGSACAAVVLALAAPAFAADPLGLACKSQNGVRFCESHSPSGLTDMVDTRPITFDGVPLDVDVTLPPAGKGNGPFPAIVMLHGYGGSKRDFEADTAEGGKAGTGGGITPPTNARLYHWNNTYFAQRGYVVLNYTARGFGNSCGAPASRTLACQATTPSDPSAAGWIHLKDRRREAHDTQFLLGKLVDQGFAKPKALGATGISYGGGESIELAYLHDRVQKLGTDPSAFEPWVSPGKKIPMSLAAAFPRWPWSDLVSSLTPNGRFLDTQPSTAGRSRTPPGIPIQSYIEGLYALGQVSGWYAPALADDTADVTTWNARVLAGEPYGDPEAQAILNEIFSFHQGFGTPNSKPAPLLIQNGWTDDLFPPAEALRVYNSLRAADAKADVALQFGDLGHSRGSNKVNADRVFNDQASAFFDKHLKGAAKAKAPAPGSVTAFTQTCPQKANAGGPFTARSWPALEPGAVHFVSAAPQTVTSAGGNPQTAAAFDPIAGTSDACDQVPAEKADGTAVYELPKSVGFTLMGLPTVSASIETTGMFGQLDSRLWDVAPGGQQTLISRGAYRLEDNQSGRITFQLHGNGWVFAKGHVPKLELLGRDAPYLRPSNGSFSVVVKDVAIDLPTLEKTKALVPKLVVSASPGQVQIGRRTRLAFRVRARTAAGKLANVKGVLLRFAGMRLTTNATGRAGAWYRFAKPGVKIVRASKARYRSGTARVRGVRPKGG